MLKLHPFPHRIRFSENMVPIVFLGVLFVAFGLSILSLGIYQDDWIFVYNAYVRGAQGLWDFLNADGTPFSSLMNIALFYLLGIKPLFWHIAALIARWLTVIAFWLVLRRLWPANPLQNFLASILFAIYPFFNLQPLAFTYLHIWIAYFFLGFSIYWMILSVQYPEKFWLYFIMSLVAGVITGLTLEYFMGLELLRPVILWFLLRAQEKDIKRRFARVIKLWMPYLILLGIYFWWRFFVYQVPIENRNDPVGIKLLLSNPVAEILTIISNIVPDTVSIIVTTWYKTLDPSFLNLTDRKDLLFTFLSVVVSFGIFLIFDRYQDQEMEDNRSNLAWPREAIWFGVIIVVLGLIPPYVGGLYINEKNPLWNSRLGLASMFGASLIIVALLEFISPKTRARLAMIALLIGLSVGYHARYTNDFGRAWKKETNLYRQLLIRIPSLKPNSAIIAEGEILSYMGDYPTAYAINTIYSQPISDRDNFVDYWFFGITTNFSKNLNSILDGTDIDATHRSVSFRGRSDQSLIISFEPGRGQCLYVIRPQSASYRELSALLKKASHLSALERINTSANSSSAFLQEIGEKYPNDWCTYYEKADLAYQKKDYKNVIELWNAAHKSGFSPGAYPEFMIFIDAFVQSGHWNEAVELTFETIHKFPIARPAMCDYWNSLPASMERASVFKKLEAKLDCLSN